ncbi:MAG: matrixin family metalloprotease [Deltaproteobacteria bacterium]|nr:matrixin family metalloprotease [Deltaproteobacteria bacterium]
MPLRSPQGELRVVSLGEAFEPAVQRSCSALQTELGLTCSILPFEPALDFAFDPNRGQYNGMLLLDWLEQRFAKVNVLALCDVDLFVPALTFVFGVARLDGPSAAISMTRLRETYFGRAEDELILLSRVEKEAVHEVGHMLGLTHCMDRNCVMHASHNPADTDVKSPRLCPSCHASLPW